MSPELATPEPSRHEARAPGRRLGGRKDRTGCITCKIRHIKCDEGKPVCWRCTSTGRVCDGYAPTTSIILRQHATRPGDTLLFVRPQRLMGGGVPVASHHEYLSFQFFAQTGASSLAGYTDVDFWTRLVPQCAHNEAAVYHAVVAVGALLIQAHYAASSESQPSTLLAWLPPPSRSMRLQLTTLAIELQNKAIQSTMRAMSSHGRRSTVGTVGTMAFVLLFCIEALQGRETEALRLSGHGIRALAALPSTTSDTLAAVLDAQLDRMRLLCGMFNASGANVASPARKRAMAMLSTPDPLGPITSLNMARDELSDLIAAVQHTVATSWDREDSQIEPYFDEDGQRHVLDLALGGWMMRFEKYVSEAGTARSHADAVVTSLLKLRHHIARVWLADAPDRSEMIYDTFLTVFEKVVAEAGLCLQQMRADGWHAPQPFMFEMGLIPPLYWTVLKCRHPRLRRKALALLRQAPAQEGLWNRSIMVQVAERVILYEEGMDALATDIEGSQLNVDVFEMAEAAGAPNAKWPPDIARIKIVQVGLRTTLADGTHGDQVQCFSMPHRAAGGLQLVKEFVAVE